MFLHELLGFNDPEPADVAARKVPNILAKSHTRQMPKLSHCFILRHMAALSNVHQLHFPGTKAHIHTLKHIKLVSVRVYVCVYITHKDSCLKSNVSGVYMQCKVDQKRQSFLEENFIAIIALLHIYMLAQDICW